MIEIKELIKQAHDNAVEKGFYDCPECEGVGKSYYPTGRGAGVNGIRCSDCNGSGIDPNKNIGELLMLIVSELGEALEAHRNNNRCKPEWIEAFLTVFEESTVGDKFGFFKGYIKDTFEDEIADVFIRLFDLCGYLGIEPEEIDINIDDNIGTALLDMTTCMCMIGNGKKEDRQLWLDRAFSFLVHFSTKHNILIQKHITAKMAYNKTRAHKHGKEY